ncbi:hypothetical protein Tco_0587150, partial [Tanacetum coccineum]
IPSLVKSQREGKAPMTTEEVQATKRTKAQIQQEKADLAEAMRLQALQDEEGARQVHLMLYWLKEFQRCKNYLNNKRKEKLKFKKLLSTI